MGERYRSVSQRRPTITSHIAAMLDYDPTRVALYSPERRETLFERGRDYTDTQLAIEAARLAYVRAEQSPLEQQRLSEALARAGFEDLQTFEHAPTDTQAYGAVRRADGTVLIAFRGTQPDASGDLKIDVQAQLIAWPESGGRVHAGFAMAFRGVRDQIESWLRAHAARTRLILAGHSLGAALATLGAAVWRPASLFTLGSPRVGDFEFVGRLAAEAVVRIVNCCDLVTDVPPALGVYEHVAPPTYLTRTGEIVFAADSSVVATDRLRADVDYAQRYAWKVTENVLTRRLADHAPINYARVFFDRDELA